MKAAADGRKVADGPAGGWRGRVLPVISAGRDGGHVAHVFGSCAEHRSVQRSGTGRRLQGCHEPPSLNMESNFAKMQRGGGEFGKKCLCVRQPPYTRHLFKFHVPVKPKFIHLTKPRLIKLRRGKNNRLLHSHFFSHRFGSGSPSNSYINISAPTFLLKSYIQTYKHA